MIEATETIVSAETGGQVQVLCFDEGSSIGRGDTLLIIDPSRPELELASARAGREVAVAKLAAARVELTRAGSTETFAGKELDRLTRLLASSTATQRQFDRAEYEYALAASGLEAARTAMATIEAELVRIDADIARLVRRLQDCYPVAPLAGTVTEKYVEAGELLSPGRPVARIACLDTVWVKAYLPAGDFVEVRLGDAATVDTEAGATYPGRVTWTSEEAEFTPKNVQTKKSRADLVYAVKVQVANSDGKLKTGMPVYVTLGE